MIQPELGKYIELVRKAKSLTFAEVAKESGVHEVSVARIERGMIKSPKWSTIQKIASVLGIPMEELQS